MNRTGPLRPSSATLMDMVALWTSMPMNDLVCFMPFPPANRRTDGCALGFLDTSNYRSRVLKPLAESLDIPKLNFQVIRRTIATRAQSLGSVKDIQSHLRHSRADTTANEYMQELPESVQQMVGTVYEMLTSAATPQQMM
jgi:integrase